jgi:mono/diheme cytochrome c family protein
MTRTVDHSPRPALAVRIRFSRRRLVTHRALLLALLIVLCAPNRAVAASDPSGAALAAELGCAGCHGGLDVAVETRDRAPDLAFAGLRYQPGYLFAYLRDPRRVRRHVGASRMPDFRLSEEEALALTLFLGEQRVAATTPAPELVPAAPAAAPAGSRGAATDEPALVATLKEHSCLTCHVWRGQGGVVGPELSDAGARLESAWIEQFLIDPAAFGVPDGVMPALLRRRDANGALTPTSPDADGALLRIVTGLAALGRAQADSRAAALAAARARHPAIDAAAGERVFTALQCSACHALADRRPRDGDAPDLGGEGIRVRRDWLRGYLASPTVIRPAGGAPGSASRMPDFRLTDAEADALADFLMTRRHGAEQLPATSPAPLDASGVARARALFTDKLPCLGCHRLGERGGMIGPDLSSLSERLTPEFVAAMIREPQALAPHAIMPRLPMPERTRELVTRFLAYQREPRATPRTLSPFDAILPGPASESASAALYRHDCAPCHGIGGKGDGFNASLLPVRPTAHADAAYLATRADDTLYDGIASGGAILNRSHLMPAWGGTLAPAQIRELVAHLRELCDCEGPAWSRGVAANAPVVAVAPAAVAGAGATSVAADLPPRLIAPTAAPAPVVAAVAADAPFPPPLPRAAAPETFYRDFLGADACQPCHAEQYDVWLRSTHGNAGGLPGEAKVIARFDRKPLQFTDARVQPSMSADGQVSFAVKHRDGRTETFSVGAIVGRGHMMGGGTQSFFGRFPDGTLRFLPFDFMRDEQVWFAQLAKDGTWVPIDGSFGLADLANWPPQRVFGNVPMFSNCDVCHGSQIQVLPAPGGNVTTRFQSLAINCESCHGPGRRHVEWANDPARATKPDDGLPALDTYAKDASLRVCFQCHAARPVLDSDYLPGRRWDDYFTLKYWVFENNPYFPDGRIATFSYQDNHQFSDCYVNGSMTCVDCHDPHSQKYRDAFGNKLDGRFADAQCTACHASKAIDSTAHTHHPEGSAGDVCAACHMPFLQEPAVGKILRFRRSDHTIAIPRPKFDASLGIDGACAQCHADKSVDALQAQVEAWWGAIKPHPAVVDATIAAEKVTSPDEAAQLLLWPGDRHVIAQFAALGSFSRRFLRVDGGLPPATVAQLEGLARSEDLDVASLALASLHFAAGNDPAVRAFLIASLQGLGKNDRAMRLRWASALTTLGVTRKRAGDPDVVPPVKAKIRDILPQGPQDRLWSGVRAR